MVIVAALAAVLAGQSVERLLEARCVKCHSPQARMSDFDVSSRAAILKGGKHGPAVAEGNAEASRLYQWVAEGKMPPGEKLTAEEVRSIGEWIKAGAPWTAATKSSSKWWAFEKPVKREPPAGEGTPIDRFIAAKLAEKQLGFSPQAEHRILIRRLSLVLTGLPPEAADYELAFEAAMEKYLASPRYGERWARHWLDVVRYGETDGGEHNIARTTAWRYRDWLIEALNTDMPYTEFVRQQIAGDVLAPEDPKKVAATGFLVAGPWDSVSAVLNKDEGMRQQARMDELDDMVTTTAHSFLALTVNCARCHDHKFDPIPTRDYYRMTAFFAAVGFGDREVASSEQVRRRREYLKPWQARMDEVKKKLADVEEPVRARLLLAKYQEFDKARATEPRRIPLNPIFNRNRFAEVRARHFRFVIANHGGKRARLERLELEPAGFVTRDWTAAEQATPEKPVAITAEFPEPRAVSELIFASDAARGGRDGAITVYRLEASDDAKNWREIASQLDHVGRNELDLPKVSEAELVAALSSEARQQRQALLDTQAEMQASIDRAPEVPVLYAAKPREVAKSYVLERGNVKKPGEEVGPGALSAVGGEARMAGEADAGARRLALADWIADASNPLTARVIVNRVWYHHFGSGLVNTPSDFGRNGDRPSHPELLDWLAVSFMEHGWSLKWLHRQIVMTRAWRQSTAIREEARKVDAGNRLIWRMPLRRMDAETTRDSILQSSGNLKLTMGGPGFALQKKDYDYIYRALDNDGPEVWRRAVYRFVVRGGERIMMDSFDCPDPSVATPQRAASNTPVQALTLMNNAFVVRQAELMAQRLEREAPRGAEDQLRLAYKLLYGRAPQPAELARDSDFVARNSLAALCRVLLNSNEFVYVP